MEPLLSPPTVTGLAEALPDLSPQVAVKALTAEPPSDPAVKATVIDALSGVALTFVGAAGTVAATVTFCESEGALVPASVRAVTTQS